MNTLHETRLLARDPDGGWHWDLEKIAVVRMTDNVVDFMAAKLEALPPATLTTLKTAACLGNQFSLASVAAVAEKSVIAVTEDLFPVVERGIVCLAADAGRFAHDRIREVVYQLLDRNERLRIHYRIGEVLLNATADREREDRAAEIVGHFNLARDLVRSPETAFSIARFNLLSGKKAMAAGAFESAFHYFKTGGELIGGRGDPDWPSAWETDYDLALGLYSGWAEAAYLIGDDGEMERINGVIIRHCNSFLDSIPARINGLHALTAQNKLGAVIKQGLFLLKTLGIVFPENPTKRHVLSALVRTKILLAGKGPGHFRDLPLLSDPTAAAQIDIMATLMSTAYWTAPNLLLLMLLRLMRLFYRHGNTDFSPYVYAGYGFILCALGEIVSGYAYGQMAEDLLTRMKAQKYKGRTQMVFNTFIRHWKEPARNAIGPLREARDRALEHGDIEFAGHVLMVSGYTRYLTAAPLDGLCLEIEKNIRQLTQLRQLTDLHVAQIYRQVLENLTLYTANPIRLVGAAYDESRMAAVHEQARDRTALLHLYFVKLQLSLVFDDAKAADAFAGKVDKWRDGCLGSLIYPFSIFYDCLARLRYFPLAGALEKPKLYIRVGRCLRKIKTWAAHAPENFGHMVWFVEAEMARRKGRRIADALYKNAIAEARKNGFAQHAAMACESLAGFYLDQGMDDFAASFMNQAVALYEQWGARAKVRKLQKTHDWLLGLSPRSPERAISSEHRPAGAKDSLDIAAVMKISQAISSEIQLDRLLVSLMRVVMENSGAEKALLILNREDRLVVDARTEANPETIRVLQSIPLEECPDLCPGVIHFARRTGAPLVIADALTDDRFSQDPYIRKNRIRSVLCLPLIRQQRTIGLIYLENNLTPNAFTQKRTEIISLLSSHTANCLENAVFFEASRAAEKQAQQQREQYQKLVETMNDGLAIVDSQLHVSYVNPALCRMTKYRAEEIIGRPAIDFLDEENQRKLEYEVTHWVDLDRHIFEIDWTVKNGAKLSTIVSPKPLYDAQGEFAGFLGIVTDVTQLKQAEKEKELAQAQLLQAQKLEAIGTLAGGVAHDFNNYLTTILGSVDLITMRNDLPENIHKHIQNIRRAAELSASLTRQLLAFGRVQMLQMTAIDLNMVINDISPMLGRLIGENITLTTRLAPDLKTITADFGQMEQIIMNLAVNARDAMPGGGTLLLGTATATAVIDADRARKMKHAVPGEYVCLSVEDTGEGMDAETVDRIFDPFFSSKAPGHGTGLGLSVVYGVVKQHHGWIDVDSAPGRGARFHIYLPVSDGAASAATTHRKEAMRDVHEGKAQRILLIEDQPEVRNVVRLALTENGYRVFEAATLADAEAVMAAEGQGFDLVFSDVILPDGNGIDFAAQVIHRYPDIRVLMSSGYTEETSRPDTIAEKDFYFLQKPYPLGQMLDTVRRILSAPPQPEE